jgi:hypothetical protein
MSRPLSSRAQWVTKIRAAQRKTAEGIIELGNVLIEAKAALGRGDFGKMLAEVAGAHRQTDGLAAIASSWPRRSERSIANTPSPPCAPSATILLARYDNGPLSPAAWSVLKALEVEISWIRHRAAMKAETAEA